MKFRAELNLRKEMPFRVKMKPSIHIRGGIRKETNKKKKSPLRSRQLLPSANWPVCEN